MKRKLDMDRIAEGLGAERRGKVSATGGYFGAMQLLADVEAKFRVPAGGGRPTDPRWTERRLVPLALKTLERLEDITAWVRKHGGINLEPMQLAALILEKTTSQLSEAEAEKRSEEHTSELQSLAYLVCRLLLEKKKKKNTNTRQMTENNYHTHCAAYRRSAS